MTRLPCVTQPRFALRRACLPRCPRGRLSLRGVEPVPSARNAPGVSLRTTPPVFLASARTPKPCLLTVSRDTPSY